MFIPFRLSFSLWLECFSELQGKMEYSWKRTMWAKTIYLQPAVQCCLLPILSHYGLFSHRASWQPEKKKSPVCLITAPGMLQPLKNGSNLSFGSESLLGYKWGTSPRLSTSCALIRLGLIYSLQERRRAAGPNSSWLRFRGGRGVSRSKDLSAN